MMDTSHPFLMTMTDAGDGGGSGSGAGGDAGAGGAGGNGGGAAGTGGDAGGQGGQSGTYTPPATQAELDKIIGDRLARERGKYADYDDLKNKVTEFQRQGMTDVEKLKADLAEATTKADGSATELAKLQVALTHGFVKQDEKTGAFSLDTDAVNLLGTGTPEQLEEQAKRIQALRGTQQQQRAPWFNHGPGGGAPAATMNDLLFGGGRRGQ